MLELEENYYDAYEHHDYVALKKLWAAKLYLIITDYTSCLRAERAKSQATREKEMRATGSSIEARKAKRWIYSDDEHVGSFVWICHVLGFNPDGVRYGIQRNWRTIGANKNAQARLRRETTEDESEDDLS